MLDKQELNELALWACPALGARATRRFHASLSASMRMEWLDEEEYLVLEEAMAASENSAAQAQLVPGVEDISRKAFGLASSQSGSIGSYLLRMAGDTAGITNQVGLGSARSSVVSHLQQTLNLPSVAVASSRGALDLDVDTFYRRVRGDYRRLVDQGRTRGWDDRSPVPLDTLPPWGITKRVSWMIGQMFKK